MFKFDNEVVVDSANSKIGVSDKNYYQQYDIIAEMKDGNIRSILSAKFYCTDTGTIRCKLCFSLPNYYSTSIGMAGGYGYDKETAALRDALKGLGEDVSWIYRGEGLNTHFDKIQEALSTKENVKRVLYRNHAFN